MTPTKAEALSDTELVELQAMQNAPTSTIEERAMQHIFSRLLATIADRDAKIAALRSPPVPEGVRDGLAKELLFLICGHRDIALPDDYPNSYRNHATAILTYMTSAGYVRVPRAAIAEFLRKRFECFIWRTTTDLDWERVADDLITALKGPT